MKKIILSALFASALIAGPAFAAGDAAAGKAKSAVCAACHGKKGIGTGVNPNLAGQKAAYIVSQLKAFKSGERKNGMMNAQSKGLSSADMENLAAYYASMK